MHASLCEFDEAKSVFSRTKGHLVCWKGKQLKKAMHLFKEKGWSNFLTMPRR